jgi:hypothetical protein
MEKGFRYWAAYYKQHGFNPMPCTKGKKSPLDSWALYQTTAVTDKQIEEWAAEDDTRNVCSIWVIREAEKE